ncbi:MAG: DinB family protein [Longimicrobiales bacterium]
MDYRDGPDFLTYFENVRARTQRVVNCIPRDRIDWRPAQGMFSFADLVRHLAATERFMFGENVQCQASRYPGHGPELADGYDGVLEYLRRMHAETVAIMSRLSAEDLARRCSTPGGIEIPVWKWLRSMIEHEVHHRGQIYLMLRLLGVDSPPLYGLTSEEVRARSKA